MPAGRRIGGGTEAAGAKVLISRVFDVTHHMDASIWDQILTRIESKVNRHSFYTWFKPTSFVTDAGHSITVRVPNILFKDWLTKHYSLVLNEALGEVRRAGVALLFIADGTAIADEAVTEKDAEPAVDESPEVAESFAPGGLNPRYTFDAFIVGPSNQFA